MKTRMKGFTLIELIVVIAIIGVLAAILVPTMLGYVRKSKISSANSAASSVYKAINSTLTELDEEGIDVGGDWTPVYTVGSGWAVTRLGEEDTKFTNKVNNFFADIDKCKQGAKGAVTGGSCIAVAVATDSTYVGTYPGGVVTSDTFETYKGQLDTAFDAAVIKAGYAESSGSYTKSGT